MGNLKRSVLILGQMQYFRLTQPGIFFLSFFLFLIFFLSKQICFILT